MEHKWEPVVLSKIYAHVFRVIEKCSNCKTYRAIYHKDYSPNHTDFVYCSLYGKETKNILPCDEEIMKDVLE